MKEDGYSHGQPSSFTNLTNDLCQHFAKCYLLKQSSTKIKILFNKNNTHYKNPPIR